jgi:glycine/D-amino acid oxidase-like deaminating enzyme
MSGSTSAEVVVCGAGIAGISAAHELAVRRGVRGVVLVDERPPLTLTSDKSTECYRNWWPGPGEAMVRLMDRSIDLLEELAAETGDAFALHPAGYAYLTADPARAAAMRREAEEISRLGAGPLVVHGSSPPPTAGHPVATKSLTGPSRDSRAGSSPGSRTPAGDERGPATATGAAAPTAGARGADLYLDPAAILDRFPFLAPDVAAMLCPRRAGWLSAQQLGMVLLERAREAGVRLVRGRVAGIELAAGRVAAVRLAGGEAERIATAHLVIAAGPGVAGVAALAGVELPVVHELHRKVTFADHLGVVPRELPLMIWTDPVRLEWSAEERRELEREPELAPLLGELPGGVHFRPEGGAGGDRLLLLWAYESAPRPPVEPPPPDPAYAEVVVRGLARMVPGFAAYLPRMRRPYVDGGYYTKTPDNRPLVGPLPVPGVWVLGALSGYGIRASQRAAELVAAHLPGAELPGWAGAFAPARFDDPAYLERLAGWDSAAGQL